MKKLLPILLCCALLAGCAGVDTPPEAGTADTTLPAETVPHPEVVAGITEEIPYTSRFEQETLITLSDGGIRVNGGGETETVYTSHDIIYYEDRDAYDSGYPYGEGEEADRHTDEEAAAHTVVNITAPGAYRVTGKLSAGQIRIDLGEDACEDPDAVVELILEDADITCTVAPAILFLNVYECDGGWSADTAKAEVDTTAAGANLILQGENAVSGAYVARIYKDQEGEKKLWKQDGAIYSYMSMNVYGPGLLDLYAANEGMGTELHLTINGGDIAIRADNDGINTNEDGVSVTTINAGTLHIIAGLGAEGDGIDSNGYLVINGGTVVASANPAADAGMDSDMGSYIHGGIVVALGSTMDWAESDSDQVTMNLQFAQFQSSGSSLVVTAEDGTVVFAYDPGQDEVLGENVRQYMGAVISSPNFHVGQSYEVHMGSGITGTEMGGVYDVTTVTGMEGGSRMAYTGTDVIMDPGGMGGQRPEGGMPGGEMPEDFSIPEGEMPGDFSMPEGEMPEDFTMPEGGMPNGQPPEGGREDGEVPEPPTGQNAASTADNTRFYMQDKVNFFSGLTAVQ